MCLPFNCALLKLPCGANSIVGQRGRVILYQNFAYELKRYAHVAFNDPAPGIAPATAWFLPFARATRSASAVKILASSKRRIASRPGKGSLDPPSAQDCSQPIDGLPFCLAGAANSLGSELLTQGLSGVATPGEGGCVYVFSRYAPAGLDASHLTSAEHSKL